MVDTRNINLLSIIQQDTHLKRVASTRGGEFAGPCPFCGGTDRFHVWPNQEKPSFWCRQCQESGDAINYIQKRDNLNFKDACEVLDLDRQLKNKYEPRPQSVSSPINSLKDGYPALDDEEWQHNAKVFVKLAWGTLHDPIGESNLQYLMNRGIGHQTIRQAQLGYNPGDKHTAWGDTNVWLPEGIVIPWWIDNKIWRINIRRSEGASKYMNVKGVANALYRADTIQHKQTVIMVEGELDALVLAEHLEGDKFNIVATGSTSGSRLLRWIVEVNLADHILLAFDADKAGDGTASWWQNQLGFKAHRLRPTSHDITDMFLAGADLEAWVQKSLT